MARFLFLCASARYPGLTRRLAERAAGGISGDERWVDLARAGLPPFVDHRPAPPPPPEGALRDILTETLQASDLVMVSPVYWYGLAAPAKLYLDHWSGWLDLPDLRFKDRMAGKRLWLIASRADPAADVTLPMDDMLRRSADWMGLRWMGALHGWAEADDARETDPDSWAAAPQFLAPKP